MANPHRISLNILIVGGCAMLYFSCSYLIAKWFVLGSGLYDRLGPGMVHDFILLFAAYALAAVPSTLILGLFPLAKTLRLALPSGVLAILLMALQGYFFILLYTIPTMISALLVLGIFMTMAALASRLKLSCAGRRCCHSSCQQ